MNSLIKYMFAIFTLFNVGYACRSVYTNLPASLNPSVPSLSFQANSINELGDKIRFYPYVYTKLNSITILMAAYTPKSEWVNYTDCSGYNHSFTINVYNTNQTLLYSKTSEFLVPWKPEHSANCSGSSWMDIYGNCWSGLAFLITFNVSDSALFPPDVIYGLSYNTQSYGASPLGVAGPYNSLNMGLLTLLPTIGTDLLPGYIYLNSTSSSTYGDSGPVNVFRPSESDPYLPGAMFNVCC